MEKIKVAVLFGGQSTEHAVSLQSACAVLHAMKGTRFEAVPVGITREGRWFWYRGPLDAVGEGVWEKEECAPVTLTPDASVHGLLVQGAGSLYLDAAFPVLHGKNGEDGTVQGLLALAGIPAWAAACWQAPCVWIRTRRTAWHGPRGWRCRPVRCCMLRRAPRCWRHAPTGCGTRCSSSPPVRVRPSA